MNTPVKRPSRLLLVFVSLLLAVFLAINAVAWFVVPSIAPAVVSMATGLINGVSRKPDQASLDATTASRDLTEEIEGESIVLLKNNGALPLSGKGKINLFGYASNDVMYGGSGSGGGDSSGNINIAEGLRNAGFEVNEELEAFYKERAVERDSTGFRGNDYSINEPAVSEYSEELISHAKEYSDIAVISFSRAGGEGADLPMDMTGKTGGDAGAPYLRLQQVEKDVLHMVEENFDTVIVLINTTNAMELGFLEDEAVDGALWVGCPGSSGCNAIADVLAGEINPSGRLTDTYAYDVTSAPSYYNFGGYSYTNTVYNDVQRKDEPYHYVEYVEGIYVGYRYYETRYIDNETGECDEEAYAKAVQYPFGYGGSYTTFTQEITDFAQDDKQISVTVNVTNTGNTAGKEVVQIYYSAPYTIGGIEKSEVVLAGFDKTQLLQPGESQEVVIRFAIEDMASYDWSGVKTSNGGYVLEAGDYEIRLQSDSHHVIDKRTANVPEEIIYDDAHAGKRDSDLVTAVNLFDDVAGDLTFVYRWDWEGTLPTERAPETKEATQEQIDALTAKDYAQDPNEEDIVFAKNGLTLSDMKGLDYDDPQWEKLLQQLSVKDMKFLVGNGGWATQAIKSVGKVYCAESDGPAGVHDLMTQVNGNQFTSATNFGSTWNRELSYRIGEAFGDEARAYHIAGLYAPGVNIHRSPFGGRNFEYVSEDGFLTGEIEAAEIQGIQSKGIYCYTKHFALNDQETFRDFAGICTWANEQSMRELYLRPFEIAVKKGKTKGIMSSFNRLGTTWTGASRPLLTNVLREEWGFKGAVVTDCANGFAYMDMNAGLRAGNDLLLTILLDGITEDTTGTPTGRQALRRASHNILYMVANSDADQIAPDMTPVLFYILRAVDLVLAVLFVLYFVRRHKKMKAYKAAVKGK